MQELIPIKVKIGLRPNKHADHPDWHRLPLAKDVDPATQMSDGWHYDKSCGHADVGADSPVGMQWGLLFVTERFAKEAMEVFPLLVTVLTMVEAEDFYDNRCTAHMPENKVDLTALQGLQAELALRKELSPGLQTATIAALRVKIAKALDPDDCECGLKKNHTKKFCDYKVKKDIKIKNENIDFHPKPTLDS